MKRTKRQILVDVVLSLFWLGLCWYDLRKVSDMALIGVYLLNLLRGFTVIVFFVVRRGPMVVSHRPADWLVTIVGTFAPFLYRPHPATAPAFVAVVLFVIALTATVVSAFAVANLGVSFGLVAANRGVKSDGFYRLVRHPIYGLYFVADTARLLIGPTPWNLTVYLVFVLTTWKRALSEERILFEDPAYRRYAGTVRWRFVPGIA